MKLSHTLHIAVVTAVCAAAGAQSALGGGEPKNTLPFTRLAFDGRTQAAVLAPSAAASTHARAAITGEAKNEQPFTRRKTYSATIAGEPKNQAPFTRIAGRGV
jgi:hypothetical protein